jgi:hypothetical protein
VDLIADDQVTLVELLVNIVAWIGIPNEACDLYKKLAVYLSVGLLASRRVKAARRTRASFDASI